MRSPSAARASQRGPTNLMHRIADWRSTELRGTALPYSCLSTKPLLRIVGSVVLRRCVKPVLRFHEFWQRHISGSTNPCAPALKSIVRPRRSRATLSCCASSRRWRLAPLAFIADASALDGAARYACPPGIGSTPMPAALCLAPLAMRRTGCACSPFKTACTLEPGLTLTAVHRSVAALHDDATPVAHGRITDRTGRAAWRTQHARQPRPAPASPVLGV